MECVARIRRVQATGARCAMDRGVAYSADAADVDAADCIEVAMRTAIEADRRARKEMSRG